ncbi:MAG: hypothetical protein CSA54_05905 [Gammaproteobacteria bacterium]|nr:MAG: hypothetical protein CSA54_05905 [Gammaproteobacteria bacterium]
MLRVLFAIPLFLYILIAANIVMLSHAPNGPIINVILWDVPLPSGRLVPITVSDLFLMLSVLFLYFETFKATRTSNLSILDHAVSLAVFVVFLIELLVVPQLGNTTFMIMTMASLMDVVMGFTVTITTARRDFNV